MKFIRGDVELPLSGSVGVFGLPGSGKTALVCDLTESVGQFVSDEGEVHDPTTDGGKISLGIPLELRTGRGFLMGTSERRFNNLANVIAFRESLTTEAHRGKTYAFLRMLVTVPTEVESVVETLCAAIPETTKRRKLEIIHRQIDDQARWCGEKIEEIKGMADSPIIGGDLDKKDDEARGQVNLSTFEIKRLEAQVRQAPERSVYDEIEKWKLVRAKATETLGLIRQERDRQRILGDQDNQVDALRRRRDLFRDVQNQMKAWVDGENQQGATLGLRLERALVEVLGFNDPRLHSMSENEQKVVDVLVRSEVCIDIGFPWLVIDGVEDYTGKLRKYLDHVRQEFRAIIWLQCDIRNNWHTKEVLL